MLLKKKAKLIYESCVSYFDRTCYLRGVGVYDLVGFERIPRPVERMLVNLAYGNDDAKTSAFER